MKKFIRISLSFLVTFVVLHLSAQQNSQYSQYLYNKLLINPAYAGAKDYLSVDMLYRAQHTKIDGSPHTMTLAAHSPLKNNSYALGGSLGIESIGPYKTFHIVGDFAYRIPIQKGRFSVGINAGIQNYFTDYSELDAFQDGDAAYADAGKTTSLPIIGFGVYHQVERWAWGISAPYILNGKVSFSGDDEVIQLRNHYFGFVEYLQPIKENLHIKPSLLLKMNHGAPVNFDININAIYKSMLWFGVGYRSENSFVFSTQYIFNDFVQHTKPFQFRIGYAFDLANNNIRNAVGGTHEIVLGIDFNHKPEKIKSPRFF
ncbi:MAG: PorP/SprF family type IX secretion system membrane protein [Chitinophagales bacterium]